VSTHAPPQLIWPEGHIGIDGPQRPIAQTSLAEQRVPHAPQFIGSV
jgi:hypothetical protein